jgi:DNA repair protein RadC
MIMRINHDNQVITTPETVFDILQQVLKTEEPEDRDREHFWVFHLTTRQRIKSLHLVSLGILNAALVHPREVFTRAVIDRCASIIIAHNHPSDDEQPSEEDRFTTRRLAEAGQLLGISLVDHVIVAEKSFYSFKRAGIL